MCCILFSIETNDNNDDGDDDDDVVVFRGKWPLK
jgi:hypothetical protein